jgi:16S rRNA (cytidine1402-2'-O)-methyltransferase
MASLYVIATPIGNLEDITIRALRILKEVKLIAAEDTRTTRKLLSSYDIHTPLTSFHERNKKAKLPRIIDALSRNDVALVSDAGTPVISDPGAELISSAIRNGIPVLSVPGPSAVTSALALSGMSGNRFTFVGFLPRKNIDKNRLIDNLKKSSETIIMFEAPHRIRNTLEYLKGSLGDRNVAILREMTKLYEENFHGKISDAISHFENPRGEFTIVMKGEANDYYPTEHEARVMLQDLITSGASPRDARDKIANETGMSKRNLYDIWIDIKNEPAIDELEIQNSI